MIQEKKPHVHADLIKAWADGAKIEFWNGLDWSACPSPLWSNTKIEAQPQEQNQ